MKRILTTAFFCLGFAASALADGRAFPPDHCATNSPFMSFSGVNGSNTYCTDGQGILSNALPSCTERQQVEFSGGKFVCADSEGPNVCGPSQVLTFSSSGYMCVDKGTNVPTCAADQFLTYNGTAFQCATAQTAKIPSCAQNQVITGDGKNLSCVDLPGSTSGGGDNLAYIPYPSTVFCSGSGLRTFVKLDQGTYQYGVSGKIDAYGTIGTTVTGVYDAHTGQLLDSGGALNCPDPLPGSYTPGKAAPATYKPHPATIFCSGSGLRTFVKLDQGTYQYGVSGKIDAYGETGSTVTDVYDARTGQLLNSGSDATCPDPLPSQ